MTATLPARRSRRVAVHVTPAEGESWDAAASRAGLPRTDWMRRVLDDAAAVSTSQAARIARRSDS